MHGRRNAVTKPFLNTWGDEVRGNWQLLQCILREGRGQHTVVYLSPSPSNRNTACQMHQSRIKIFVHPMKHIMYKTTSYTKALCRAYYYIIFCIEYCSSHTSLQDLIQKSYVGMDTNTKPCWCWLSNNVRSSALTLYPDNVKLTIIIIMLTTKTHPACWDQYNIISVYSVHTQINGNES